MKSDLCIPQRVFVTVAGMLLTGCLLKPVTDSTRHFVLAPIATNEPAQAATGHLSVGIGVVKMPAYLLRNSLAIRDGANEIEYLEDALWGERLDRCLQRTVAANLSRLLSSDSIYLADWWHDQTEARVFINVQQFDVDVGGHGTLIAQWRITVPNRATPLKSGEVRLDRTGASPRGNPKVIAATLSELTAEFSRDLAQSIREAVKSKP